MLQQTFSPIDGRLVCERELLPYSAITPLLDRARAAQAGWRTTPLDQRIAAVTAFVDRFLGERDAMAHELTLQMGRPIRWSPGELGGFEDRARTMLRLAPSALADLPAATPKAGFERFVRREPLGLVLVLAAWNYPYLITVNSIVPALLAGNAVLLKHSDQTPLCAERLSAAANGTLPDGLLQHAHMSHATVAQVVADPRVDFVAFTGSVEGGRAVHAAAAGHFKGVGLELGGKDPAYVRADADLDFTVPNLVEGALFNSGQSCCGLERIYVHRSVYDEVIERMVPQVHTWTLGNPLDADTMLGPVARERSADAIRASVQAALDAGARGLIDASAFPAAGRAYVAPQVLVDVTDDMEIMAQETFGPVVGVIAVDDDADALRRMNNSRYGLTASVWTEDLAAARGLGERLETGTVFMNRCDYLDPELAWVGVKDSGRGCTLSPIGFEHLTRPKSFHLRHRRT
jgi:acyl-CoA reductase-like NAD-dependent aldehyde dehydrogenase